MKIAIKLSALAAAAMLPTVGAYADNNTADNKYCAINCSGTKCNGAKPGVLEACAQKCAGIPKFAEIRRGCIETRLKSVPAAKKAAETKRLYQLTSSGKPLSPCVGIAMGDKPEAYGLVGPIKAFVSNWTHPHSGKQHNVVRVIYNEAGTLPDGKGGRGNLTATQKADSKKNKEALAEALGTTTGRLGRHFARDPIDIDPNSALRAQFFGAPNDPAQLVSQKETDFAILTTVPTQRQEVYFAFNLSAANNLGKVYAKCVNLK